MRGFLLCVVDAGYCAMFTRELGDLLRERMFGRAVHDSRVVEAQADAHAAAVRLRFKHEHLIRMPRARFRWVPDKCTLVAGWFFQEEV